ncbi:MAG: ornithine cyclodeaminase family protein [Candidatus Marinimicrobia bacterium]|jgi:ornithine cyclodeaminase|nr:ornithine cyclodeaminase family protein [Candidatus Neomarinimicrobiota bacterium]MDP6593627.1 ornithine cyclodeaminase family protein [Candidatus Neomarinimicrobiota bacterium]MDP6836622.1 ornithine cyclodeaminase family protein [Candidatus Neomarinimicrobiota bacterium]|tara:strand:- start:4417 stop:5382 length:966 start_codon:yes stop_codon:yes gene_type:complete
MKVVALEQIKAVLPGIDLIPLIEEGFVAYSQGRAVVPPVGELIFKDPPGDVHIKYGYIEREDYFVIKIASGFPDNEKLDLPSGSGMMLLFRQETGEPVCLLHDEAYLTDIRTAVAGAVVARYLAPQNVEGVGIVGTGNQARLQLEYLKDVVDCRDVLVWGRREEKVELYVAEMAQRGFAVEACDETSELTAACNLIITATSSTAPLLTADEITPGTHITAMGSDTAEKRELDGAILAQADLVVADSISQCRERGEIMWALREGNLQEDDLVELGEVLSGSHVGRQSDDQTTVADLTGVAVQDIQIARAVYETIKEKEAHEV